MKSLGTGAALALALSFAISSPALAQAAKKKAAPLSPAATVNCTIDGATLKLEYSRPYTIKPGTTEVRKIWGGLIPFGKVWRTGANAATKLTTDKPIEIGGVTLDAGSYNLFTVPESDGSAKLVINKKLRRWGIPYDEAAEKANELARIDLTKKALDKPVDQFTMAIEPAGSGGVLKMAWEKTEYSVPFTVKK